MNIGPHHHPCVHCGVKTECCGDLEQNYDGFPEWICRDYHLDSGIIDADFVCEDCAEQHARGECDDCGAWGTEPHVKGCTEAA